MAEITTYRHATFCWADLATTDADGAKAFYTGLFGWEAVDEPTEEAGIPYTMLTKDGKEVCALYAMGPDAGGTPPHWRCYVKVDDIDATAEAVTRHGGSVLMPPMDVMDAGRMAIIQDPTGAVLGLWQPDRHPGAALWNEPGAMCWTELLTRDLARAEGFFQGVLGWTTRTSESVAGGKYQILLLGDEEVGGMMEIEPEWGEMVSNWTLYFAVPDCDGTIAAAERAGGSLLFPAMEIADVGRFAYLQDPQGAVFAIIQMADTA